MDLYSAISQVKSSLPANYWSCTLASHFLNIYSDTEEPMLDNQVFHFKGPGGQTTNCPWISSAIMDGKVLFLDCSLFKTIAIYIYQHTGSLYWP